MFEFVLFFCHLNVKKTGTQLTTQRPSCMSFVGLHKQNHYSKICWYFLSHRLKTISAQGLNLGERRLNYFGMQSYIFCLKTILSIPMEPRESHNQFLQGGGINSWNCIILYLRFSRIPLSKSFWTVSTTDQNNTDGTGLPVSV